MAEWTLSPVQPGRFGRNLPDAGIRLRECTGFELASVLARRGQTSAAVAAAHAACNVTLPLQPRAVSGGGYTFVGTGPGQWLALSARTDVDIEHRLAAVFATTASVCAQSDGRIMLQLDGPRVRDTLAKGLPIDLHPRAFPPGSAATSSTALIGLQLWLGTGDWPWHLLVTRTYFESFWRWLVSSAAEFGGEIQPPTQWDGNH
jgi:sarcosine oxidase subunit gamma